MIEGTTKNGFNFRIEEDIADDWEILEAIRKSNEDAAYVIDVAEKVLGNEQLEDLKEHCRENGKVRITRMSEALAEIFDSANTLKNS